MQAVTATPAEIVGEIGPIPGASAVHGVTFDGHVLWAATGKQLVAVDPLSGAVKRSLKCAADAGTAFDGKHLYQIAASEIHKIDPQTGQIVASIPAPGGGGNSGLTWAEGSLWVGSYRARKIYEIDAQTGAVLSSIQSDRFVTGVTWVEGELWHGTWESDESELRRVDPQTGEVYARLAMPAGKGVSGLESNGADLLYAGGGGSGTVRSVRRRPAGRRA
ncbi:hypothetical protein ACPWT1_20425 [Ramlibacter sp. MMS24-I3-19]|uniref:Vgb family protein n=1 Tax=Ramlibacter sp. MMS24-I3-19 TaxID=3416606 RepID=UPI003D0097CC